MKIPPEKMAARELAAVLATGGTFLVFENLLHLKLPFLVCCSLVWGWYIYRRIRREPSLPREWGMRMDNLAPSMRLCGLSLVLGAAALLGYRLILGWKPIPWTAAPLFLLYPIWGFIQQFLVQGLITRNLLTLGVSRAAVVPISAVFFGLAHTPDWPLVGLCVLAGLVWTVIFLRVPNLIPLGITHGWLGGLTYYCVLVRDPWMEMFAF